VDASGSDDATPDHVLVRRAKRGDAAAFERLYERHRDWCHGLALRTVGDRDLAEEAVQEAFLQWMAALDRYEPRARVRTWLHPVVRHVAIRLRERRDRGRAAGGAAAGALDMAEASVWATAHDPDLDEEARRLRRLLAKLPEGQREVILLRVVEGLGVAETALALGIAPGTVKSRLALGLARLREVEGDDGEGPDPVV